jgi:RimJ/RimL family protein N-acetyltransferase
VPPKDTRTPANPSVPCCIHLMRNGMTEIRATIDVRNAPSISVAERVGFVREATVISEDVLEGVRGTDHHYVLRTPRS